MSRVPVAVGVPVAKAVVTSVRPNWWTLVDRQGTPTTATADATPHTLGPWTELIASTAGDADLVVLALQGNININGATTDVLVDIGIGAAAAEVAVYPSVTFSGRYLTPDPYTYIPLWVPKGSRLSFRCQGSQVSETVQVTAALFRTYLPAPTSATSLGAVLATSKGVTLSADNTWTEIVAATAEPYVGLGVSAGCSVTGNTTETQIEWGVGAAGAEVTLGTVWGAGGTLENWQARPAMYPIYAVLPAGVRLAARRTGGNSALNVTTHGLRRSNP